MDHQSTVEAAIQAMHRAGFRVLWTAPEAPGGEHVFTTIENCTGDAWVARGADPVAAMAELQRLCGFEDAD